MCPAEAVQERRQICGILFQEPVVVDAPALPYSRRIGGVMKLVDDASPEHAQNGTRGGDTAVRRPDDLSLAVPSIERHPLSRHWQLGAPYHLEFVVPYIQGYPLRRPR